MRVVRDLLERRMRSMPTGHADEETTPGAAAGRARLALGMIVAAAFAVRLGYLFQIEDLPFFYQPIGDAKSYWEWAGRIAAGDWLGREAFYQAPGYPYFLAVVRRIAGDDLWLVRLVQIALGSISCGLLAMAARRFFSASAGLWTGALIALYAPAIFFDGLIQKAGLGLFLMSGVLCLVGWSAQRRESAGGDAGLALLSGMALGLLSVTVEQALLLVPVVLVAALARPGKGHVGTRARRLLRAGGVLAGCGLVLGPVAWRNHHVAGVWAVTTVQAGPNFYIGNHAGATGRYVPLVPGHETPEFERRDAVDQAEAAVGKSLTPAEVSRFWSGRAWAWIRAHPGEWVRLTAYKWLLVWNAYEIPDTESYTLYRDFSWVLGVLGRVNHFGVLCPLAAVGFVATMGRRRRLWPLYAMILAISFGVAAFYVFGRYRFPLVPPLALFAGCGAHALYHRIRGWMARGAATAEAPGGKTRDGERRPLQYDDPGDKPRGSLVVLALAAVATHLPVNPERELDALAFANLGAVLGQQGNYDGAIYCLERALRDAPDSVDARFNLGMALRLMGNPEGALAEFRRVQSLDPHRIEVDFQLGSLHEALGQNDLAAKHYRRALEIDPNDADARAGLERLIHAEAQSSQRK